MFAAHPYNALPDPLDRVFAYLDLRREILARPIAEFSCVAGTSVQEVITTDGVKLRLGPSHWLMLRFSGTEPLLRVMVEGQDAAEVGRLATRLAEVVKSAMAA